MEYPITELTPGAYWKVSKSLDTGISLQLAEQCYREMLCGNRVAYIWTEDGEVAGEISLVFDNGDEEYTIPGKRAYLSRLIVKPEWRRRGIGTALTQFVAERAKAYGYDELSLGVDLDNYEALKLYVKAGFRQIIRVDEDEYGKYVKLKKDL